jgi:hypothetical protein
MKSTTYKKTYTLPECEVVEVELENSVLQGSGGSSGSGFPGGGTEGLSDDLFDWTIS